MEASEKLKRKVRITDVDVYIAICECANGNQVISKLGMDKGGKSYKRIKKIMERYNISYGNQKRIIDRATSGSN